MKNLLSIDVEEIFHTHLFKEKKKLEKRSYRSPKILTDIFKLLGEYETKATFFVDGEITLENPRIIKSIVTEGHEAAYHGWSHRTLWETSEREFCENLDRFLKMHPGCIGFRAPTFSLDNTTKWALKHLEEKGIKYDSSIFPTKTPLYGIPNAPTHPYTPHKDDISKISKNNKNNKEKDNHNSKHNVKAITEYPLLTYKILGIRLPAAGGFYLRLSPKLVAKALRQMNKHGHPGVIYLHTWELDKETPRVKMNPLSSKITYHNITKTTKHLKHLLKQFKFTSIASYMRKDN